MSKLTGSTGDRLLHVLSTLVEAGRPVSLPELTELVGLPKPTVHRLISLLELKGYAIKDLDERRFLPGPALHELALTLMQSRPGIAVRHAVLQRVADAVGEACNIVMLDGNRMLYIDRVDTAWPLRIRFDIGSHVPVYCTATGKLLLSLQPKRVRDRLIHSMTLEARTEHTISDPVALEAALKQIRRDRIGTDDQEFLPEMVAVSVPIEPPKGPPVAAISIHAPIFRRSLQDLRQFVPQLRTAAQELSALLYEREPKAGAAERRRAAPSR